MTSQTIQTTQTIQGLIQQIFINKVWSPSDIRTLAFYLSEDLNSLHDASHYYPYGKGLSLHISHYNTTQGNSWFIDLHISGGFYVRFSLNSIYPHFFTMQDLEPSENEALLLGKLRDELIKLMSL